MYHKYDMVNVFWRSKADENMGNECDLTSFLAFVASRPFGFVLRSAARFGAARRRFRAARPRRGEGARAPAQKRRGLRIAQMGSN